MSVPNMTDARAPRKGVVVRQRHNEALTTQWANREFLIRHRQAQKRHIDRA
jgi:hypothetical protein